MIARDYFHHPIGLDSGVLQYDLLDERLIKQLVHWVVPLEVQRVLQLILELHVPFQATGAEIGVIF